MAGIYWNEELGVISLSSDGENWITISDKNLGATTVYHDGDTLSEANCGKFYQWGNNYGFPFSGGVSKNSTRISAANYGPGNYYSSSTFIYRSTAPYNWDTSGNNDLWGAITGTKEAMQGPCSNGFHIPTNTELSDMTTIISSLGLELTGNTLKEYLLIPFAGYINYTTGGYLNQGTHSLLWASNAYDESCGYRLTSTESTLIHYNNYKTEGNSIRPFANIPVIPDYTWTKLYGDDIPEPQLPKLKRIVKHNNYYFFGDAPTHASGITLNKSEIILTAAGQTEQLIATVTPADAVNKKVVWSSSDTTVATVSNTGLVTCITPGECVITCTAVDGGASATCEVIHSIPMYIDFLLVAGGGGGGSGCADYYNGPGGGGAGGVIQCCGYLLSGDVNVVIGNGGVANTNGGNSCFGNIIACGGGRGGNFGVKGGNGGSGGGGANGGGGCGEGIEGQGYNGGAASNAGGGGGGAGGAGGSGDNYTRGGYGGDGIFNDFSGDNYMYAGGGGGYGYCGRGAGGNGGGGAGGCVYVNASNASYYGGGGGGNGGCGYQGLLIARYLTSCGYELYGGCKYTCGDYTIHCFTEDGVLTSCPPPTPPEIEFLLIAGGGGGGNNVNKNCNVAGGGGAGGLIHCDCFVLSESSYSISIGQGGSVGGNGGNSSFGEIVACGGGAGNTFAGCNGGSGGGGGYSSSAGTGVSGQGNSGGTAPNNTCSAAGGGGGAGGSGGAPSKGVGGTGGNGLSFDIDGTCHGYAGGGGGAGLNTAGGENGYGGGIGRKGGNEMNPRPNANYYGGGGGGGYYGATGGTGYQGIFIARYLTACGYNITGGTCYTCGDYTIHCFTSDGTLTVN